MITYKDKETAASVKRAAIKAGLWDQRWDQGGEQPIEQDIPKKKSWIKKKTSWLKKLTKHNKTEEINDKKGFFTNPLDTLNIIYTYASEIRKAIRKSKRKSAAGPDGLKMSVYSEACENLILPLQALFNTINSTGLIPDNFKTAKVILLHKKKSKQNMANYRPISMSNHISKIWERIVNNRLMTHLEKNNRLSRHQHGFRPKRGCHSNLIEMWERCIDKVDKDGPTIEMWSFDLQKAFDMLAKP